MNKKKLFFTFWLSFSLLLILTAFQGAIAAPGDGTTPCSGGLCLGNPLGSNTLEEFIGRVLNSILGVVGSLALVMFIYGGLTWMTSAGNAEKVKKGRDILIWSAIGLFVVFSSYALVRVVLTTISS